MLEVERTNQFKRDWKLLQKRGKDPAKLRDIILKLSATEILATRYRDHNLSGNYKGTRECHIEPDWLLIYSKTDTILRLERTGSHADLFN